MIYVIMNRDDFLSIDAIRFGWNGLWKNVRFFVIIMVIMAVLLNLPALLADYVFHLEEPNETISAQDALIRFLPSILSLIIFLTLELGLLRIALNFEDKGKAELSDLFREYPKLIKFAVASILFGLMIILPRSFISFGGALLEAGDYGTAGAIISLILSLIILVAIIYLFLKYQFYGYVIVDRGSGPIEALKESGRLTEGILKNLFLFWLELGFVIAVIQFAVIIAVGIIEIPVTMILYGISEDLASLTVSIISSAVSLFAGVPIIMLATADIYRTLERRSGRWAPPTGGN